LSGFSHIVSAVVSDKIQVLPNTLKLLEGVKKAEKLALLITSEDKSNKQHDQATHSFSLTTKPKLSIDLIFRSQQI